MAVSAQPTPLFCTSLRSSARNSIGFSSSNLPLCLFSFRTMGRRRTSSLIVFCNESSAGVAGRNRRDLLEGRGIDLDELLAEPFPKPRKRKERKNNGKGKQSPDEKPKPPRETHKLLQVLGGKARRMKLISPKGMDVRPMMEVVKGAAFSILQVAGGCPALLRSGHWLDLYSGTGSVGIEALSRGCSEVHFVEMDPWVVSDVLRPNLEWTKFLEVSTIHTVPVESFLERARHCVEGTFDYISVTPPYTEVVYKTLMGQISESGLIGEDTFIVVEYPLKTNMSDSCGCLLKIADRRFGRTNLAIYGPKWAQKKRDSVKLLSA